MTHTKRSEMVLVDVSARQAGQLSVDMPLGVAEILAEPLPTYQIRGLLAKRAVHVIYGDSQSGKTFLVLDIAATIATGGIWRGIQVKPAPVLYVSAEGNGGLGKRIRALTQKYPGLPAAPLKIIRQSVDLINSAGDLLTRAQDLADDRGPLGLIVLDTLAQTIGGRDENGPDMALYISRAAMLAQKTGAPVVIVHHAGKDQARGARGHSSLRGNIDVLLKIAVDDDGRRYVESEKTRDDEKISFGFRLSPAGIGRDEEGVEHTSCTVTVTDDQMSHSKKPLAGKNQKLLYRLAGELADVAAKNGCLGINGRPAFTSAQLQNAWRETKKATGAAKQGAPSYMSGAMSDLIANGYLANVGSDTWTLG